MKAFLKFIFLGVLAVMTYITVKASMDRNVMHALSGLWQDPWVKATLCDTYFAFMVICLWVGYKEKTWPARILWSLAILILGNFAIAAYMLIQLFRLKPQDPVDKIWTRNS
jgi:hypothetical protein